MLDNFLEITLIANAFRGIKVGVGLLILNAGINMVKKMKKKSLPVAIALGATITMLCINLFSLKISSITLMLTAGMISLGLFLGKGGEAK